MTSSPLRTALLAVAIATLPSILAPAASAQVLDPASAEQALPAAMVVPVPSVPAPALFDDAPVAEALLARVAGREDQPTWQAASAQGSATVRNNSVGDNSPTGALSVSDAAFQNVSGISMVNLNTGNASSINASMSINLSIQMTGATPDVR